MPDSKITSIADAIKAIEHLETFSDFTVGDLIRKNETFVILRELEASVRERKKELEKEFASKYRLGVEIPVIERHRLTLIHGGTQELRRLLEGERGDGERR